jgi:hypothetical protein
MRPDIHPLISGNVIPRHWCRIDNDVLYIYFPNPKSDRLKFPLSYGQSLNSETKNIDIKINHDKKTYKVTLKFEPYQSLLYKIEKGKIEQIDIKFIPKTPVVKERPAGYEAPWLVK